MIEMPVTNATEFTVSELANALKRTLEDRFGFVRLRGEISGYRGAHGSGHAYFCLKDEAAKIDAVIWRGVLARMRFRPEEGMEVIASGKITTFPGKSTYQIVVDSLEPAGVGALMALLEERRRRLAAEGLFDAARKQLLPYLPKMIGVITSPTGAVVRDILHRIAARFPRRVLVWPVRVQGTTSAHEIAAAIEGFNALDPEGAIGRPDVLIVARGGGSLEDLWGFNEEIIVRAAARSHIPLIAAVGHETDWTLIDHAADIRAPTPTAAAEMCVPVRVNLLAQLAEVGRRHRAAVNRDFERRRTLLRATVRALPGADDLVALPRQRFDIAGSRLIALARANLDTRRILIHRLAGRLAPHSPLARLARLSERLANFSQRLRRSLAVSRVHRQQRFATIGARLAGALRAHSSLARQNAAAKRHRLVQTGARLKPCASTHLSRLNARLENLGKFLNSLGYRQVLARGFALVRDPDGRPLRSAQGQKLGEKLDIEFSDGHLNVTVGETKPRSPVPVSPRPKRSETDKSQGSLF
jgi:exodeoxyribonuclease VII large subunit